MSDHIHKSAIQTVAAYQTVDGKRFDTPHEAQEHTRHFLIDSIIAAGVKAEPQFARLDPELLRKFCRAFGAHLGNVMGEPFKPLPMAPATGGVVSNQPAWDVHVENKSRPGEIPKQGDRVEVTGRPRTDFGAHPLSPLSQAMRRVDEKLAAEGKVATLDATGLSDAELEAELSRVMTEGSQSVERKAV